jgi:hypothetical protein
VALLDRKTVLVLGAGASAPYGHPLGAQLLEMVLAPGADFYRTPAGFADAEGSLRRIRRFRADSLDEIVRRYPQDWPLVKYGIASILLKLEDLDHGAADDWYAWFFKQVLQDDPNLGDGQLSVITYNYDLSFDAHIHSLLATRHGLSEDQAAERLREKLKIHHMYGHIGPVKSIHGEGRSFGGPYNPVRPLTPDLILQAAAGIVSVDDPKCEQSADSARRMIAEAEHILFVGFGWAQENVDRLDLKTNARSAWILSTTVGIEDRETRIGIHLPDASKFYAESWDATGTDSTSKLISRLLRNVPPKSNGSEPWKHAK